MVLLIPPVWDTSPTQGTRPSILFQAPNHTLEWMRNKVTNSYQQSRVQGS